MNGHAYTPERAKRVAHDDAVSRRPPPTPSNHESNGCALAGCFVCLVVLGVILLFSSTMNYFFSPSALPLEERQIIINQVCDELYGVPYNALESLNGQEISETIENKYNIKKKFLVNTPATPIEAKQVSIKIVCDDWSKVRFTDFKVSYAAVLNKDGSFTLEPYEDFFKRIRK